MKKVLLVSESTVYKDPKGNFTARGGGEVCIHNLAKAFLNIGYLPTVFGIREFKGQSSEEEIDKVKYERFPIFSRSSLKIISYLKSVLKKAPHYDLLVLNQFSPHVILPWLKTKNIALIHDTYKPYGLKFWIKQYGFLKGIGGAVIENFQLKFDRKYAHKIMTVSDHSKKKLISLFGEEFSKKIFKNPFPISISEFYKNKPKEDFILFVGRFVDYKHPEHVLYVLKKIKEFFPKFKAVFIVSRNEKKTMKKFMATAKKLYLDQLDFKLIFDATHEEVKNLFTSAKLLIQPSFVEGQGIVVLEALAAKTPVIAYDLPAYDGMLINNFNSLLVKKGDMVELSDAAVKALRSFSDYSENCHISLKNFSFKKFCETLEKNL